MRTGVNCIKFLCEYVSMCRSKGVRANWDPCRTGLTVFELEVPGTKPLHAVACIFVRMTVIVLQYQAQPCNFRFIKSHFCGLVRRALLVQM